VDVELDSVEGMELELGDEVWVGVADVLEEELIESGELVEEVADTDEEDVVTGVEVDVFDEVMLELAETVLVLFEPPECLPRALCKTSPRPRALTALPMDCSTSSFGRLR